MSEINEMGPKSNLEYAMAMIEIKNKRIAELEAELEELQKQEIAPKGFIVVSKDLLAEAIACNTDASLVDARHIINSVLKVSDDEIFREALKELEGSKP